MPVYADAEVKLGVSMYSYFQAWKAGEVDAPAFIRIAKEIGADGVELLNFSYKDPDSDRPHVLEALAETGLVCSVFSVSNNFAKHTPDERNAEVEKIRFGIEEALRLGAGVVRVFAGDVSEGLTYDQVRAWIIDGLTEGSKIAYENGIKLALENHGHLAGRGDQVREIIEEVRQRAGNDALGANPDTGNFLLVGQESHDAIRQVAKYAYMVHFKDFATAPSGYEGPAYSALDGTKFVGTAVGEGTVNLEKCVLELKEAGFDGWLNVEYEAEEDPFTGVPRSVANARKYLV